MKCLRGILKYIRNTRLEPVPVMKFKAGDSVRFIGDDGTRYEGTVAWAGHDGPKPRGLKVIEYVRVQWNDGDADTYIDEEINEIELITAG